MSNRRHWYLLNNEKMLKGLFMSDALTQLNNIRTLRSQTREMSLDVLEDVLEKFKIILIERREEETLRLANESQRRDKLETLRQMMLDEGIDPSELMAAIGSPGKVKKTHFPRPAKYRYTDETGESKTWSGQGRMPKRISKLIAEGGELKDFEIS
ncbi:H-NS histone family protein [Escherichia coli]|uniref:DNA-binding protein n=3 Tax=Enterobacteriaceae TaxID=543 RepID=A0A7Z7YHZ5_ESCAL|nr:H-NS histone family protein [Escherichia coli]EFA4272618.1 H-NS histone family protein [Escherichia coli O8]EFC7613763.1 H-NS histone family protein [Escherichia albertii]EFV0596052.1 H-NS histone family protein [Salmonella enterica subsp. enterica serovar 4,[5],12:i:-]EET0447207.1 H-NS histone family protein [Escherichia coli]